MNVPNLPSFDGLRRRFRLGTTSEPRPDEAAHVIKYVQTVGRVVRTGADLLEAVALLQDEEELAAFRCREGVAVTHLSDGWWLLYPYGPLTSACFAEVGGKPLRDRS